MVAGQDVLLGEDIDVVGGDFDRRDLEMLATRGKSFKGLRVAVSGSGNVAQW